MPTDASVEHPQENEQDLLPEIIVDETAEDFVQDDEPPAEPEPEPTPEQEEVVVEPELPPAPEQDNIFQTGKPVKKKRNVSEKQKAHLDRIRAKALERKREKADERAKARSTSKQHAPTAEPVREQRTYRDEDDDKMVVEPPVDRARVPSTQQHALLLLRLQPRHQPCPSVACCRPPRAP